ncbi:hypothetical protein HOL24_09620 [bacterium]|jgi:asparagine synthase (glutamine-hydrolysing)|nr:hypothetical protein [bacterium]
MIINIKEKYGWKIYKHREISLWFNGYLTGYSDPSEIIFEQINTLDDKMCSIDFLSKWIENLHGHFAFVVKVSDDWCFVAADKICSIPLFIKLYDGNYYVSNYAPYLKSISGVDGDIDLDLDVALEISMSGFALGGSTLYKDINRLSAGECLLFSKNEIHKTFYYEYVPQELSFYKYEKLKENLTKVLLSTLQKTIDSVNNRQIVVPLSAGNDSRLVASGLKKLGYKNVVCFSYGRSGNYEVETSKKVCEILGYKWIYIQDEFKKKRNFFLSDVYEKYVNTFESYASVPNIQDIYEVYELKKMAVIDDDAVIVNGNSGDFISGGHIPVGVNLDEDVSLSKNFNWTYFLEKHYSLWGKLRTRLNNNLISLKLSEIASKRCKNKSNKYTMYSVMECMECIGRQSRLVSNQQRSYEFFGHEWRLPLWDEELLDFWEGVPIRYKIKQKLYKEVLNDNDWGGVWSTIPINKKIIRPYSIWILRLFVKIIVSPFGRRNWHKLEKKIFVYWMHPSYARAVVSYFDVLFDNREQRNTNSWTADQFVNKKGLKNVMNVSNLIKNKYNDF